MREYRKSNGGLITAHFAPESVVSCVVSASPSGGQATAVRGFIGAMKRLNSRYVLQSMILNLLDDLVLQWTVNVAIWDIVGVRTAGLNNGCNVWEHLPKKDVHGGRNVKYVITTSITSAVKSKQRSKLEISINDGYTDASQGPPLSVVSFKFDRFLTELRAVEAFTASARFSLARAEFSWAIFFCCLSSVAVTFTLRPRPSARVWSGPKPECAT
ncbi:hypothetical protein EVAR_81479_1 [Eumeta japonica]|uniref:Uncharacterized protein n=1 Tax=Eumeta variegata TaxID=151549 RepID=A0A4C1W0W3_EUMVA|nr:hypothetical protein EVAR_81479_1 [Eumeta japonica]